MKNESTEQYHFGKTLRWVLEQKGITQTQLSKILNHSESEIEALLSQHSTPPIRKLKDLCDMLDVRTSFFLFKEMKKARLRAGKPQTSALENLWFEEIQLIVDENDFQKPAAPKQNAP